MSLATSHSRRRTKLHTRVVGSPSGTPIKVTCPVLNTVGGPQGGSFTGNELPKRRTVLSVARTVGEKRCRFSARSWLGSTTYKDCVARRHTCQLPTLIQRCSGGLSRCSFEQQASFRPCRFRGAREGLDASWATDTARSLSYLPKEGMHLQILVAQKVPASWAEVQRRRHSRFDRRDSCALTSTRVFLLQPANFWSVGLPSSFVSR